MAFTPPTIAQFKAQFVRDFPYAPPTDAGNLSYVTDVDIQSALNEAGYNFNDGLFSDMSTIIYLYLSAHMLVVNIQNASKGLASQARFPLLSTGVGSVNLSNNIPELFQNSPMFNGFLKTGYGQKYLDLVYPFTIGNVGISCGTTTFA